MPSKSLSMWALLSIHLFGGLALGNGRGSQAQWDFAIGTQYYAVFYLLYKGLYLGNLM